MKNNIKKHTKIFALLCLCLPAVHAETHIGPINIGNIPIKSGDVFKSNGNDFRASVLSAELNNRHVINLDKNSGITVDLKAGLRSNNSSAIFLGNGLVHNLGGNTQINVESDGLAYGLRVHNGSTLNANNLRIIGKHTDGGDSPYYGSIGIDGRDAAQINLGQGSYIVGGTQNKIEHGYGAIVLRDQSNLVATNLYIKGEGLQNGLSLNDSTANLGNQSTIEAGFTGVYVHQGSDFTANELNIIIHDVAGRNEDGSGINLNSNNNSKINLGSNSTITTFGDNAFGVYSFGGTFDAKDLNISTQGARSSGVMALGGIINIDGGRIVSDKSSAVNGQNPGTILTLNDLDIISNASTAVFMATNGALNLKNSKVQSGPTSIASIYGSSNSQLNLENVEIVATSKDGIGLYATTGAKVDLMGNNSIHAPKAIYVSQANSFLTQSGLLISSGDIAVSQNGEINLNTTAGSIVNGAVYKTTEGLMNGTEPVFTAKVHWKGDSTVWNINVDRMAAEYDPLATLNSYAVWLDTIDLTNSTINMSTDSRFNKIYTDTLDGSIHFIMKTDIVGDASDKLIVKDISNGNHNITVKNNGAANTTGKEQIVLVKTSDGQAIFTGNNDVELGGYTYGLRRENNDANATNWELAAKAKTPGPGPSEPEITTAGQGGANTLFSNYLMNYLEIRSLSDRLGELRFDTKESSAWVRSFGGKIESKDMGRLASIDMEYYGIQLGYDQQIMNNDQHSLYLGGAIGYLTSDNDLYLGSGDSHSVNASLYLTYLTDNDFYVDTILKYGRLSNSYKVLDTLGYYVHGKDKVNSFAFSVETGKRFYLTDKTKQDRWYVEPQLQYVYSNIQGGNYQNTNGLSVRTARQKSNIVRVGLAAGYEMNQLDNPLTFYAKVDYLKEFSGKYHYYLNSSRENLSLKSHWFDYGVGFTTNIDKQHHIFAEVKRTSGQKFKGDYRYNVGYRFEF